MMAGLTCTIYDFQVYDKLHGTCDGNHKQRPEERETDQGDGEEGGRPGTSQHCHMYHDCLQALFTRKGSLSKTSTVNGFSTVIGGCLEDFFIFSVFFLFFHTCYC